MIIPNLIVMKRISKTAIHTFTFFALLLVTINSISLASDWTEVRTLEGKFTTLSQHFEKDKWTLVMLWTTDCGICQREYPVISEFHDKHKDTKATKTYSS